MVKLAPPTVAIVFSIWSTRDHGAFYIADLVLVTAALLTTAWQDGRRERDRRH